MKRMLVFVMGWTVLIILLTCPFFSRQSGFGGDRGLGGPTHVHAFSPSSSNGFNSPFFRQELWASLAIGLYLMIRSSHKKLI